MKNGPTFWRGSPAPFRARPGVTAPQLCPILSQHRPRRQALAPLGMLINQGIDKSPHCCPIFGLDVPPPYEVGRFYRDRLAGLGGRPMGPERLGRAPSEGL